MNKTILCIIDSLGPGGAQRQIVGLATLLKNKDYNVIIVTYHEHSFYVEQLINNEIQYVFLKKAENKYLRIWYIIKYIQKLKPNIVISYLEIPSICASIAKIFNHNFKLIVSERSTTQHTSKNEIIRFNIFRLANYIVSNSYSQEKYICTTFPQLTTKVKTIPNFVDINYFVPPPQKTRSKIYEIIVVASIWASKNTLGFIDAVSLLKNSGYIFHISWYGKSDAQIDYFNRCEDKIRKMNLTKYLTLKKKTSKILEKYQESDCFCL